VCGVLLFSFPKDEQTATEVLQIIMCFNYLRYQHMPDLLIGLPCDLSALLSWKVLQSALIQTIKS
jgi:hypothetical protein